MGLAEDGAGDRGEIGVLDQIGADGVFDVVVQVGDGVGEFDDFALEGGGGAPAFFAGDGGAAFGVAEDAVTRLEHEVEALAVILEVFDDAERLFVVAEAVGEQQAERCFAGVTEGGVAEVVAHGDGLGEVFVEAERAGDGAGDLLDLDGVGHAGDDVVGVRGDENLGLVLETAEGAGVDDSIAVELVGEAELLGGLGAFASARISLTGSTRRQQGLARLERLSHTDEVDGGRGSCVGHL